MFPGGREDDPACTANSLAPWSERKPPEIFCRSFIIRPSRSARLLVKGTRGSVRNAQYIRFADAQAQQQIMANPSRLPAAAAWPLPPARSSAGCA